MSTCDSLLSFSEQSDCSEEEEEDGASDDLVGVVAAEVQQMDDMSTEKFKSLHDSYKLKLNSS